MANSEEADLMSLGEHCSHELCRQVDFLPFTCDCCDRVYCLEHRTYAAHQCPKAAGKDATVILCPLCARAVRLQTADEDPNLAFERHARSGCDPSNYARVHSKRKCPVKGCKEKLTSINEFRCKDCGACVCLRHRLAVDHACPGRAAAAATAAKSFSLAQVSFRSLFGGSGGGQAAPAAGPAKHQQPTARKQQQAAAKAAAAKKPEAKAAAGLSIQQQLMQYRRSHKPTAPAAPADQPAAGPAHAAPGRPEACTVCGARFASVVDLIAHAEAAHQDGWASSGLAGGGGGGPERCPHCGLRFRDPVELVTHVEKAHAAQLSGNAGICVLC